MSNYRKSSIELPGGFEGGLNRDGGGGGVILKFSKDGGIKSP